MRRLRAATQRTYACCAYTTPAPRLRHTTPVTKKTRSHADDLRGATRLVVEATRGVMELVQAMQVASIAGPAILGRPLEGPAKVLTGVVHGTNVAITRLVGSAIDAALARLSPVLGSSVSGPDRDAVLGALNGIL